MDEGEQDKSEQATQFKLSKARQKGTVARGTDLGFMVGLAAFAAYLWMEGPALGSQLGLSARRSLVAAPQVLDSSNEILAVTGTVMASAARPLAFLMAMVFLSVLVFELVQTGVVFTTEPMRPDFGRLNPSRGFKRVFSMQSLIQTGKNILKLAAYAVIAFLVIREAHRVGAATITDAQGLAETMLGTGLKLIALFVLVALAFAALDQLLTRRAFSKRMRMSRREIKRERRDREGEPRMKQRRKQLHAEFVKLSQSLRGIRGADLLITNPTHFAVGLKYDPKTMAAPKVVAQGSNQVALRLRRLAFQYGVVTVPHRDLARALYYRCEINKPIPEAYYKLVADIYLAIRAQARQQVAGRRHV